MEIRSITEKDESFLLLLFELRLTKGRTYHEISSIHKISSIRAVATFTCNKYHKHRSNLPNEGCMKCSALFWISESDDIDNAEQDDSRPGQGEGDSQEDSDDDMDVDDDDDDDDDSKGNERKNSKKRSRIDEDDEDGSEDDEDESESNGSGDDSDGDDGVQWGLRFWRGSNE